MFHYISIDYNQPNGLRSTPTSNAMIGVMVHYLVVMLFPSGWYFVVIIIIIIIDFIIII